MDDLSRRRLLAAGTLGGMGAMLAGAAHAAGFGNPDLPPQGAINAAGNPQSLTDPGPRDATLARHFPAFGDPPATDVGDMPLFWASFNTAHKRIQNGGWAREVTQADFEVASAISGVNMRLTAGGIREMHWHQQAEWAYMTNGRCRITILDAAGRASVEDVAAGDLWYFPAGLPHSLQGLGPDGAEFLLAFDNGRASEYNTLLVTDWLAHTPPAVLALNFGVPEAAFVDIPLTNKWIFQGAEPGPLEAAQQAVQSAQAQPPEPFIFRLGALPPAKQTSSGTVRIADSSNFKISTTVAAALVTVKPGGLRELHWHPNADEWQYYIAGSGRMTVFDTGPNAQTADFHPGDVGYVRKSLGHYVQNTGADDLVFLEIFKAPLYQEVSLSDWLTHTPPAMVTATLGISADMLARFPTTRPDVVPA